MLEEGFSDWRIGALATRLRCSRSTLYKLAPCKEELVLRVFESVVTRALTDSKAQADSVASPAGAVIRYTESIHRWQKMGSRQFWVDVSTTEAIQSRMHNVFAKSSCDAVKGYLDRGVATGDFRPANTAFIAAIIWQSSHMTRNPEIMAEFGLEVGPAVQELGRFIVSGMGWPCENDKRAMSLVATSVSDTP